MSRRRSIASRSTSKATGSDAHRHREEGSLSSLGRVLAIGNYRLAWPSLLTTAMGQLMWTFVTSYLIFEMTGSTLLTTMVTVTNSAPLFLFGILAGTLADAYNRRSVMVASGVLMSVAVLAAAVLAVLNMLNAWNLLALSLMGGLAFTANNVTRRTFTFDIVGSELVPTALAADNIAMTLGNIAGPFVGGVLLDVAPHDLMGGAARVFLFIFALYAGGSALLYFVQPNWTQEMTSSNLGSTFARVGQGLSVVGASSALLGILGITIFFNIVYPARFLLPAFQPMLHISVTELGVLGASQGIGALFGAVYLASRGSIKRRSTYYWVGSAVHTGFLAVFAVVTNFPLAFIALFLSGFGQAWFGTMQSTLVMLSVPDNMRGRVMGILSMAIGIMTLGSVVLGVLAEAVGPAPAILIVASSGTIATVAWATVFKRLQTA